MTERFKLVNKSIIFILTDAFKLFNPSANSCSYDTTAVDVTPCAKDKVICHISTHCIQTNSLSALNWKTHLTPLIPVCHYLPRSPPLFSPSHSFPWKCQWESLFAVIRESATFNQPLSQMSPNTLFICGLTCEKHTARGIYWRGQHEASFKLASIKALRTLYTQLISSSAKHNNLRGSFCTVEVFARGGLFMFPGGHMRNWHCCGGPHQ